MPVRTATRDEPTRPVEGLRVMTYCHDSVGIGHLRRTLAITDRIARMHPRASFLLATGTPYVQLFSPQAQLDYIKLPALTKHADGTYHSKLLGLPIEQLLNCREALLVEAARTFRPHLLLVDKAPLGVCRELIPTLRWLRAHRPATRIVFGMRDIEDDAPRTIAAWQRDGVPEALEEFYDELWVYGAREVFDVVDQYRLSPVIASKTHFMGYIGRERCSHAVAPRAATRTVLVTVGGGTDGERVLEAYLGEAAERVAALGARSVMVGGPDLPAPARARLSRLAGSAAQVEWLDFERCMQCRMRSSDLIVTMGGYNTLCELAGLGKPALVIPRTTPRLEQHIRALIWERLGLLRTLPESEFTPAALADRVADLLAHPPVPDPSVIDMGGLERVAERFSSLMTPESHHAPAVPVR